MSVLMVGIITPTAVCTLMCGGHSRAESQRHCNQASDTMPGMAHDHSAMNPPSVKATSLVVLLQSCQPNCVTAERLALSRKVVPQVTVVQTGAVVLDTRVEFLPSAPAAAWSLDSGPPILPSVYAASFSVLRI